MVAPTSSSGASRTSAEAIEPGRTVGMVARVPAATEQLQPITALRPEEFRAWPDARGQPPFRAGQVRAWLGRGAASFEDMHDLPAGLRSALAAAFRPGSLEAVA